MLDGPAPLRSTVDKSSGWALRALRGRLVVPFAGAVLAGVAVALLILDFDAPELESRGVLSGARRNVDIVEAMCGPPCGITSTMVVGPPHAALLCV